MSESEFTFDVKLWATVRVFAKSEREAREKLRNYTDCLDIGIQTPDRVTFTEASAEGEADLVEVRGEWKP